MQFLKLQFRPGIVSDTTSYAGEGGWYDCDKVRFKQGFPESIGGWTRFSNSTFLGTCRSLHPWVTLEGERLLGIGTHLKFYIARGQDFTDVTPIRSTTAAGDVTFSATSGSTTITVSDVSHGAVLNDFVTFSGAVSLGGTVTADVLNAEHQITRIVDANTYEIEVDAAANASDTGNGGASVVGAYQINVGLDTVTFGTGWGTDAWGDGGWGEGGSTSIASSQLRIWSQDNFGEDLLTNVHDGGIYYWDASGGLGNRMVELSSLSGANLTPTIAKKIIVSDRDRHVLAFGCDPENNIGVQDPLLIRFSSQESLTDWETRENNTAGDLRLGSGSEIITAIETKQQVLVFTDVSLHAVQWTGAPFTFGVTELSPGVSIIGQNAAVAANDVVYWMGEEDFYIFDGSVRPLGCPVSEKVFDAFNFAQGDKVFAGHQPDFSEVWWFYPCNQSTECSRYVVYNYADNIWYFGTLPRTAWEPRGVFRKPIAAGSDNYLYYHEDGVNDGSQNPPVGFESYIESSDFDLDDGYRFMFVRRIIPDVSFLGSEGSPTATMTITGKNYPGGGLGNDEGGEVTRTATVPIEQYTRQKFVRLRARTVRFKIEANEYNTAWKLGAPRLELRPDGRR